MGTRESSPIVGRADEVQEILDALADPSRDGAYVFGPVGVGKSRLVQEVERLWVAGGGHHLRAFGSPSTAALPFGTVAHLLPISTLAGDADPSAIALFHAFRAALWERTQGERTALFVDDAHWLDPASLALVTQLVAAGLVFVVATIRTGEAMPEGLGYLADAHTALRLDLADLDRAGLQSFLEAALGGPCDALLVQEIWQRSRGNPMFARELITAAKANGTITPAGAGWRLNGSLSAPRRLADLVERRLSSLDGAQRSTLELVAVTEPIDAAMLGQATDPAVLTSLVRLDLVREADDGTGLVVRCAHPLYGEVLRASIPAARRRALLADHAARLGDAADHTAQFATQVALWRIEAGLPVSAELLTRGVRLAEQLGNWSLVDRLAAAGVEAGQADATVMRAKALYFLGRHGEALSLLQQPPEPHVSDTVVAERTIQLAWTLYWGHGRYAEALDELERGRREMTSPRARSSLALQRALGMAWADQPRESMAIIEEVAASLPPGASPLLSVLARVEALRALGRTRDAVAAGQSAVAAMTGRAELASALTAMRSGTVMSLVDHGRADIAAEWAFDDFEQSTATAVVLQQVWSAIGLGRALVDTGRFASGARWYAEARTLAETIAMPVHATMALAGVATAHGQRGDTAECEALLPLIAAAPDLPGFVACELARGHGWALVACGRPEEARALFRDAFERAVATGQVMQVIRLGTNLSRLGEPRWVLEHRDLILADAQSPFARAAIEYATGVHHDDPHALARAGDAFAEGGVLHVAAEIFTRAGEALRKRGERRDASAASERADRLRRACEDLRTPGVLSSEGPAPLTRREREVAALAASGLASKDIASRLYLSARTVDNHLQNAYTKLGISTRSELAGALGT